MPPLTVIINVLNGSATLPEAVDSVLAQTFADWELIVWDDCSTDGSADTVAKFADSRIRYVRAEERVSPGQARQQAIKLARGEWIAFLDQDDTWLPHKLERQMELAHDAGSVGLIYGRTVRFYPNGKERDYDQTHEYAYLPEGDIFAELFVNSCFIAMSSVVFRRSAIAERSEAFPTRSRSSRTTTCTPPSLADFLRQRYKRWCAVIACTRATLRGLPHFRSKRKHCA